MTVNLGDVIQSHLAATLATLYTALPAQIESYDATTRTISATPVIRRIFSDGTSMKNMTIDDIPVVFPSGGGAEITMPLKVGDKVLLIFSMRNIQDWMQGDGIEVSPYLKRNHSIQDAIAIPSMFTASEARAASTEHLEIIFGQSKIQVQEDAKIVIESGTVELGEGATESVILGETFRDWVENHRHVYLPPNSVPAFTSIPAKGVAFLPPVPDPSPDAAYSDKVKVK